MEKITEKRCCFTGHRPEKLNMDEKEVKRLLAHAIQDAVNSGFTTFITGMAKGVDIWAGELVMEYKNIYPSIKLIAALPYPGFSKNAPNLIKNADFVHTVSDSYDISCFQRRNEWMVDNSSLVIAFFTGEKGGTYNTIKYAEKKDVEIMYVTPVSPFRQIKFIEQST